jgi:hypothetical protein
MSRIAVGSMCITRSGGQYKVKALSSTGVATLVTDFGSFVMYSHVSVLTASRPRISSRPKSLAERLCWMAANLPGFQEELDAVNEALRRQFAKPCTSPARSAARTADVQGAAQAPLGNPALNPDSFVQNPAL